MFRYLLISRTLQTVWKTFHKGSPPTPYPLGGPKLLVIITRTGTRMWSVQRSEGRAAPNYTLPLPTAHSCLICYHHGELINTPCPCWRRRSVLLTPRCRYILGTAIRWCQQSACSSPASSPWLAASPWAWWRGASSPSSCSAQRPPRWGTRTRARPTIGTLPGELQYC